MMSLMELNYYRYEKHFELEEWAKAEHFFNCEGFFDLLRNRRKK